MGEAKIVYVGKVRGRYRLRAVLGALGVLWNALRGWRQTVVVINEHPEDCECFECDPPQD